MKKIEKQTDKRLISVKTLCPELGLRTLIMGVLNVTPDSFSSDGSTDVSLAVSSALQLVADGADIIDIGGESTRPGHSAVDPEMELTRVIPVLEQLRAQSDLVISIDTTKAEVGKRAVELGATIINCVTIPEAGSSLLTAIAESGAVVVITDDTQIESGAKDVVERVFAALEVGVGKMVAAGISEERIIIDPGIGFGKRGDLNVQIIRGLSKFKALGLTLLVGPSRKSFLGEITGKEPGQRDAATAGIIGLCVASGADIVRVHNVAMMKDVVAVVDRVSRVQGMF